MCSYMCMGHCHQLLDVYIAPECAHADTIDHFPVMPAFAVTSCRQLCHCQQSLQWLSGITGDGNTDYHGTIDRL